MSLIVFVIPTYRESRNVLPLLAELQSEMAKTAHDYEVLFVDDGSPDDTWETLLEAAAGNHRIRAIRLSRNFGKEAAIAAGLEHAGAGADAVVVMDADLQHPCSLLPEMIRRWQEEGAEIVEAIKRDRGREAWLYRLCSRLFYWIASHLSRIDLGDVSDFKLMDAKVVAAWGQMRESNLFFRGMSAWVGFRRVRLPFTVRPREAGTSGWGLWQLVRLAVTGITAFTSFPLRLVSLAGLVFLVFSVIWGTRVLLLKIQGNVIDGMTTLILLQLIVGSMLLLALGVIGEYIARIYHEVKLRPRYVVRERVNPGFDRAGD